MKLISDFDGIWTNQAKEAEYVWNFILNYLSELTSESKNFVSDTLSACKKEMNGTPELYGWYNNGAVACYYNEDPFGDNNAIFDYINKTGLSDDTAYHKSLKHIRDSILKKYNSLADFSQDCFFLATTKFKEEGKLSPVSDAAEVVQKINSSGTEIIIVSNSKTKKIEHVFEKAGIKASPEHGSVVRVRGDAMKFVLDNSFNEVPEYLNINDKFSVPLRRKSYYEILKEEKPDIVIGDVFSLDLSLPLYLRLNRKEFSNLKVVQRVQTYTPYWVKNFLGRENLKGIAFMVNSVSELPDIISEFS